MTEQENYCYMCHKDISGYAGQYHDEKRNYCEKCWYEKQTEEYKMNRAERIKFVDEKATQIIDSCILDLEHLKNNLRTNVGGWTDTGINVSRAKRIRLHINEKLLAMEREYKE